MTCSCARFDTLQRSNSARKEPQTIITAHRIGWSVVLAAASLLILWNCQTSHAQILIDNFSDGNDDGWLRVDTTTGQPWGPGTFDANSLSYHLETTGEVPMGEQGILLSIYEASSNPAFNRGYLRTNLRTDNDTLTYLVMRGDTATFTGYVFGASANTGRFFWNKVVNNVLIEEGPTIVPDPPFAAGEDWVLEAGAIGDQLSMKAWRLGDAEPAAPQWLHRDSTIAEGVFGVGANHWAALLPSIVTATFDDIYFTPVPEPSTLLLVLPASLGAIVYARRRRASDRLSS